MAKPITVIVIPVDGPTRDVEIDNSLDAVPAIVGGGLEVVSVLEDGTAMVFNDNHRFAKLPLNKVATRLLTAAGGIPGDWIGGDVVVVGPADHNGDTCSVTDMGRAFVAEMTPSNL